VFFSVSCGPQNIFYIDIPYAKMLGKSHNVTVGDIPNRYTSDVVLNQQARVVHQGGMADCLPGGPVAGETMTVLDTGAHGGSVDRPMVSCLIVHT
jgi:hypothetical protein